MSDVTSWSARKRTAASLGRELVELKRIIEELHLVVAEREEQVSVLLAMVEELLADKAEAEARNGPALIPGDQDTEKFVDGIDQAEIFRLRLEVARLKQATPRKKRSAGPTALLLSALPKLKPGAPRKTSPPSFDHRIVDRIEELREKIRSDGRRPSERAVSELILQMIIDGANAELNPNAPPISLPQALKEKELVRILNRNNQARTRTRRPVKK